MILTLFLLDCLKSASWWATFSNCILFATLLHGILSERELVPNFSSSSYLEQNKCSSYSQKKCPPPLKISLTHRISFLPWRPAICMYVNHITFTYDISFGQLLNLDGYRTHYTVFSSCKLKDRLFPQL